MATVKASVPTQHGKTDIPITVFDAMRLIRGTLEERHEVLRRAAQSPEDLATLADKLEEGRRRVYEHDSSVFHAERVTPLEAAYRDVSNRLQSFVNARRGTL